MKRVSRWAGVVGFISVLAISMWGQCDSSTGFMKKLCQAKNGNFNMASEAPLTTTFSDAIHGTTLPPSFNPPLFKDLASLTRADDGAFILKPGFYQITVESYAIEGGVNPAGMGFYPAPIKGGKVKAITELLKNAELHPEAGQADIQAVLTMLASGADLNTISPAQQQAAAALLSQDTLKQAHAGTSSVVGKKAMDWLNRRIGGNAQVQQGLQVMQTKQSNVDQKFGVTDTLQTFGGMDTGTASTAPAIPRGTWAQMPGGFYVRYFVENAGRTKMEIAVSDAVAASGRLTFDPTQYLAVSGGQPSIRLGISMRVVK